MNIMNSIASASMGMSQAQLENAYGTSLMKRSMNDQEQQAETLINDMLAGVPVNVPSQYSFDVYA